MNIPNLEPPDVSAAVSFLTKKDPGLLKEIESADVDEDVGVKLGGELATGAVSLSTAEWRTAANTLRSALTLQLKEVENRIATDRQRLVFAGRFKLVSDIVAVIGPASIFAVLETHGFAFAAYVSAAFVLLAAILAVVSGYVAQNPLQIQSLLDEFKSLADWRGRSSSVMREIIINYDRKTINADQRDLLKQASELCKQFDTMAI